MTEKEKLKHEIERYVKICGDQCNEIEQLRRELADRGSRIKMLVDSLVIVDRRVRLDWNRVADALAIDTEKELVILNQETWNRVERVSQIMPEWIKINPVIDNPEVIKKPTS